LRYEVTKQGIEKLKRERQRENIESKQHHTIRKAERWIKKSGMKMKKQIVNKDKFK